MEQQILPPFEALTKLVTVLLKSMVHNAIGVIVNMISLAVCVLLLPFVLFGQVLVVVTKSNTEEEV